MNYLFKKIFFALVALLAGDCHLSFFFSFFCKAVSGIKCFLKSAVLIFLSELNCIYVINITLS